jgi:hypothetical protein
MQSRLKYDGWNSLVKQVPFCPFRHGIALPQLEDGGDDLKMWEVPVNILNGMFTSLGFGRRANKSSSEM